MKTEKTEKKLPLTEGKTKVTRNFENQNNPSHNDLKKSPNKTNYPKLIKTFHLDSNCVNARGLLPEITELEKYEALGVIEIEISNSIEEELYRDAPDGIFFNKAISSRRLCANAAITTIVEYQRLRAIENIVFPGAVCAPTENNHQREKNDLYALFTAWKCRAIFVTNDGSRRGKPRGILTHKNELKKIGVDVMSSMEALSFLYKRLSELALEERKISKDLGEDEPAWVAEWILLKNYSD